MIRDVLVHVDATPVGLERLRYAYALTSVHLARLTAVHVKAPIDLPPLYKPSRVEGIQEDLERRSAWDAEAAQEAFEEEAGRHPTEAVWKTLDGGMAIKIREEARYADLVIVGQYESEGSAERHPTSLADDLVVQCGRPVIVTPEKALCTAGLRKVLVAWDGSREAVRALHDALPLLAAAKSEVDIVSIEDAAFSFDELAAHLGRHGITVGEKTHIHSHLRTGATLMNRLAAGHYDLLVMGAYGHPTWLELLFGGTTKSALMQATTPVLAAH